MLLYRANSLTGRVGDGRRGEGLVLLFVFLERLLDTLFLAGELG
jgi:hypothetical protein